jgi:hypothetical protein
MCSLKLGTPICPLLRDVIMNMGRQALARTCCRRSPHATDMVLVEAATPESGSQRTTLAAFRAIFDFGAC